MHFVRIGKKALNLDSVCYCEAQIWQDAMSLKTKHRFGKMLCRSRSISPDPLTIPLSYSPKRMPRNCGSTWITSLKNPSNASTSTTL